MRLWHYVSQAFLAAPNSNSPSVTSNTNSLTGTTMASKNAKIYFGYGSNLWREQMEQRCPTSEYLGIARLNNFKWLINERGYANVVEIHRNTNPDQLAQTSKPYEDEVWGLVYTLQQEDERRLDRNEGVHRAYTKELLDCDFWESKDSPANVSETPKGTEMLVYINRDMVDPSKPKHEYIYRMNMGIRDAVKEGVPKKYVDAVMRKFIPEMGEGVEGVEDVARKQAAQFEDER